MNKNKNPTQRKDTPKKMVYSIDGVFCECEKKFGSAIRLQTEC